MNKKLCFVAAALIGLGLAIGPARSDEEKKNPTPRVQLETDMTFLHGRKAPAIDATKWVGSESQKLSALSDKVVLLNFWEAWSSGCRRLNKRLVKLHKKYGPKGLRIIGIHPAENGELAVEMVLARKYNFPLAIDSGKTAAAYGGAKRVPVLFLIVGGKVVYADIDNKLKGNLERAIVNGLAGTVGEKTFRVPRVIAAPKISKVRGTGGGKIMRELGGKQAPKLSVASWAVSKGVKLAELKGKVVLIDFWGVWCSPCVKALPHMIALHKKYKAKGLVIVGMHTEMSKDQLPAFLKTTPIPYPIAIDGKDRATQTDYGVRAFPTMVFIGRKGRVRYARVGWSADTEAIVKKLLAEGDGKKEKAPKDGK